MPGLTAVTTRLAALPGDVRDWNKETVERAAKSANRAMLRLAPESDPRDRGKPSGVSPFFPQVPHRRLKVRLALAERTKSQAQYQPVGRGGGGTWMAEAGPVHVGHFPFFTDPAYIVAHGSGIRGIGPYASHKKIQPARSPLMVFSWGGRKMFATEVGGQSPQRDWVLAGRYAAKREIRRRLVEFDVALR